MPSVSRMRRDDARRRDEHVDVAVLPLRERVALEVEIHAAGGDDQRARPRRSASAAPSPSSATAIGSCAWTTSGLHVAQHAAELPGRPGRRTRCAARSRRTAGLPARAASARRARARRATSGWPSDSRPVTSWQDLILAAAPRARRVDVDRCDHAFGSSAAGARAGVLERPQLRELQKHVVRVHHRDDEARGAVQEAAAEHVVAEERRRADGRSGRSTPARRPLSYISSAASVV